MGGVESSLQNHHHHHTHREQPPSAVSGQHVPGLAQEHLGNKEKFPRCLTGSEGGVVSSVR